MMLDNQNGTQNQLDQQPPFGMLSAVLGFIALASAALIGVISFTAFNPPDWARFGVFAIFILCFFSSIFFGILGLKNQKRAWAIIGLMVWVLTTMICIGMLFIGG